MAKQMGNGFPLAAIATTKEIANCFAPKVTFTTFGANPIAMAVGREVLKIIDDEKLQANCKVQGEALKAGLKEIAKNYSILGDVRGQGLMVGIDVVVNSESDTSTDVPMWLKLHKETKRNGILLGKGGKKGCTFRFQPSMCITSEDVEFTLDAFERSVKACI